MASRRVASLAPLNALVNYWWKATCAGSYAPATALGCLMHCILTFRALPPAEPAAWKGLLDHYVFGDDDPAAHIPAPRRGILGELGAEQLAEVQAAADAIFDRPALRGARRFDHASIAVKMVACRSAA